MPRRSQRPTHPGLASLLKQAGLAHQQALAERIGLPKMTVYRVLGNFNAHSSFLVYCKVADGYDCSVDHLAFIFLDHDKDEAARLIRELVGDDTQKQIAEKCGIPKSLAHELLTNNRQHMQLATYRAIARGLYISLQQLSSVLLAKTGEVDTTYGALTPDSRPVTIHSVANRINIFDKIYDSLAA